MNISELIKFIRKQKGYTQEQLARELNVSFSTINRWENGRTAPSILAKIQLLDYCKKNGIEDNVLSALDNI